VKSSSPKGTITAPPSKSYTHRALILGALTHSDFLLSNPLMSDDTKATLDALYAFGTEFRSVSNGIAVHCEQLRKAAGVIDARNSGTTIRLVTGLASLLPHETTLTGDDSLIRRPMGPLAEALESLGATVKYLGKPGCPPLKINGPITGSKVAIRGDISSQFVSSLLIACSQKDGDTEISLKGTLTSKPYVGITLELLKLFGGDVEERAGFFKVKGNQKLKRDSYTVPGDYSSAAFPLAAAAITGGDVTVKNLARDSPQGDRAIVDILSNFGAEVTVREESTRVASDPSRLHGCELDVLDTPDLFPIAAVIASVAQGKTLITGGRNLRQKESDRIATTTGFLSSMGADIKATDDGCIVNGVNQLHGAQIHTEGDHRIFMAAAVAGLIANSDTIIDEGESFAVSYPGFLRDLHQLGCRVRVRR
jgi:3-phosphoshikimate 1-carboxyvinyltransferase